MKPLRKQEHLQPAPEEYRTIALTQGQFAIVDIEDFESLCRFNWFAHWSPIIKSFYAVRCAYLPGGKRKRIAMARLIIGVDDPAIQVDHKNRDTLDNRRGNLRRATVQQNQYNKRNQSNNRSGFKGVRRMSHSTWGVRVYVNGKRIYRGGFKTPEEAARKRLELASQSHGEFYRSH